MTKVQKILTFNKNTTIVFFSIIALLFLSINSNTSYAQNSNEKLSSNILISKSSSNSYSVVNGTAYIKPFFDTTYVISGSSSSFNNSQNLINSTIINDFLSSPTIGYIIQTNNDTNSNNNQTMPHPSLPNPFVDIDDVTNNISDHLSAAVTHAIKSDLSGVDIKCNFGNNIQQWTCEVSSLHT